MTKKKDKINLLCLKKEKQKQKKSIKQRYYKVLKVKKSMCSCSIITLSNDKQIAYYCGWDVPLGFWHIVLHTQFVSPAMVVALNGFEWFSTA